MPVCVIVSVGSLDLKAFERLDLGNELGNHVLVNRGIVMLVEIQTTESICVDDTHVVFSVVVLTVASVRRLEYDTGRTGCCPVGDGITVG